jgi:hypothetical protein
MKWVIDAVVNQASITKCVTTQINTLLQSAYFIGSV